MPFRLKQCLSRFRRDQRGNIAIIFGIAAIPLISAVGSAVDYSLATRMKAKLQSAADAASIAALAQKSPGFLAASVMSGNGSVTAGVTDANNVFDANMSGITGYQNLVRTSSVTKTGIKLTASVQFTAEVPVTFMKVLGFQKLTVTGLSSSAAALPPYLDFYLTLDVSGSMGLPSTSDEQKRLGAINPDNWVQYRNSTGISCTLACHFAPQKSACVDPPVTAPYRSACQSPHQYHFVYTAIQYEQLLHGLRVFASQPDRAQEPHQPGFDQFRKEAGSWLADSDASRPEYDGYPRLAEFADYRQL
ncbi:pilus assembly protein TadG-related protein [Bradyrhizobium sp. AZCC 1620]|uniref:pilus assembly protein TadG-related protein n=1 Tax=Bradyrhizobium sp. AZCC 1620 TaxID=3117023 RepID=UPI002FF30FC9